MHKRIHYHLLLSFLGLIAIIQVVTFVMALHMASALVGLADPGQWVVARTDHSVSFPLPEVLRHASDMSGYFMIVGVLILLICGCAGCTVWHWARDAARVIQDYEDTVVAQLPPRHRDTVVAAEPKCYRDEEAEKFTSMFHHLVHKAQHDPLTGLPNRSLVMDRLKQVLARAERHQHCFAVLFIDLDGFKALNDTYGHKFGDEVLCKTAQRFVRSVRALDTVARLGGDEFLLILDQVDASKALETAQTLTTIVRQPVMAAQGPVSVGMSTGIAMFPAHGRTVRQLIAIADAAMYVSKKESGKPVLAATQCAPVAGRDFESTTTTTAARFLETWEGTVRGLRSIKASLLPEQRSK